MVICCLYSSSAQENTIKKPKFYETWISLDNKQNTFRGILYEINDSSILVSNSKFIKDYSTGNFTVSNLYYNNIDLVKIRRIKTVKTGALTGAAAGLAGAIALSVYAAGEEELSILTFFLGFQFIPTGALIGALVGSHKIRFPLNRSIENFNKNKSRLQKYSFVHEYSTITIINEHKGFIGPSIGPSFPLGDFANKSMENENAGFAETGFASNIINLGYNFTQNFGISVSNFYSEYNIGKSSTKMLWKQGGIIAGPLFSIPVNDNLFIDMKPGIGYASSYIVGNNEQVTGNGMGVNFSTSLRYNFSDRWCILSETGYFSSNQKFEDGNKKMQVISLGFGITYRFK